PARLGLLGPDGPQVVFLTQIGSLTSLANQVCSSVPQTFQGPLTAGNPDTISAQARVLGRKV
ncbi:hypothetical protein AB0333_16820, partial [Citricoccus sp. NPDC079358]|uniref:hypothetical protein n=1 Tax=Citricoccus sp. NPDC079358 TaxID=3154653 RepID=UPI00344FAFD5